MDELYEQACTLLQSGSIEELEALALRAPSFPGGTDPVFGNYWITLAIVSGSIPSIEWMLRRGVSLAFRDDEGYTPVHAAIDRERDDRHAVLELLLTAGADVNRKGLNDWTPAHMAAARDDVEALKILVRHGADLTIRTDIDDYATPLEEARNLERTKAALYLEGIAQPAVAADGASPRR